MTQQRRSTRPLWSLILGVGLAMLPAMSGCGGSPGGQKLVPIRGKVTYNGQPLAKGTISFMPLQPGNTAAGEIVDGSYTLSTYQKGDGAPPGEYRVAITSWSQEPDMNIEGVPAIPRKYFSTDESGLTAQVTDQSSRIDFDLVDH